MQVTIVGAGVAALTTALTLQSHHRNLDIKIVADKFTSETTSAGAAGIFRPGNGLRGKDKEEVRKWIQISYNFYNEILQSRNAHRAGVLRVDGYLFSNGSESTVRNALLEEILPVYRPATEEELVSICAKPFLFGSYFQTLVIGCEHFLPYAMECFTAGGGKLETRRINSFGELGSSSEYIMNCTGLGAKWLCGDDRLVPIRGQVYKVKAPWIKMFYYGENDTYIIPGMNTVTLGGTRNFDSSNTAVDKYDSASIMDKCCELVPNLRGSEVVKEWVGLRPYRDQVRLEFDQDLWEQKKLKVIHNYGHGGYGVTATPGTAASAVQLFSDFHRKSGL